jgi:hypothetical protein
MNHFRTPTRRLTSSLVSTENLASWHNVAALIAGWQPFSLANVSHEHGRGTGSSRIAAKASPGNCESMYRFFAYRVSRISFRSTAS